MAPFWALVAVATVIIAGGGGGGGAPLRLAWGYNVTRILEGHPEFSTFNEYLTATHLAVEINRRDTLTVLAIDNAGMSELLSRRYTLPTLKNILKLHILVDYYGAKKIHQLTGGTALTASMFQATGAAPGTSGYINISDHRAGLVTFFPVDDTADADDDTTAAAAPTFVRSVKEIPYNLSIIEISSPLNSLAAESPAAASDPIKLSDTMSGKGCRIFSDLLSTSGVEKIFDANIDSGLTVFCPADSAMKQFLPKFENLTADAKQSLLLFHGYPVYNTLQDLKTSNGLVSTLATDGTEKNYKFIVQNEGNVVQLKTKVDVATITKTLLDEDPCAVYAINKVLQPIELFKSVETPVPAAEPAESPEGKKKKNKKNLHASPTAAEGPDGEPEDEKVADDAGDLIVRAERLVLVAAVAAAAAVVVF